MGSYGIGVGRLLACVAEEYHDDYGLTLPVTVAPFQVHMVAMKGGYEAAEALYQELQAGGVEVLYDNREETPGVKFADADLIGNPIRLTVSARSLGQGGVEMKLRREKEVVIVPLNETLARVQETITRLETEISEKVIPVSYTE